MRENAFLCWFLWYLHFVRSVWRLPHSVASLKLSLEGLIRLQTRVGSLGQAEQLPEDDAVAPDVGLAGKQAVGQRLYCHPLDGKGTLEAAKVKSSESLV